MLGFLKSTSNSKVKTFGTKRTVFSQEMYIWYILSHHLKFWARLKFRTDKHTGKKPMSPTSVVGHKNKWFTITPSEYLFIQNNIFLLLFTCMLPKKNTLKKKIKINPELQIFYATWNMAFIAWGVIKSEHSNPFLKFSTVTTTLQLSTLEELPWKCSQHFQ